MLKRRKKDQDSPKEQPVSDEVIQAIRRTLTSPDGKVLLNFLKERGGVDIPTYQVGKTYEAMIHLGARKALVNELLDILKN